MARSWACAFGVDGNEHNVQWTLSTDEQHTLWQTRAILVSTCPYVAQAGRDACRHACMQLWRRTQARAHTHTHTHTQVADMAMLPPKDTRELLYRMLQGGFVFLQVCIVWVFLILCLHLFAYFSRVRKCIKHRCVCMCVPAP